MKRILLASLVLTAAVAAPFQPAQAGSRGLLTADQRAAFGRDLERAGVDLIFTSSCPDDMAGIYNHERMTLKVCSENIDSGAFLDEVIAHETVHVIQHCVGSFLGVEGLMPIHSLLAQGDPAVANQWLVNINRQSAGKTGDVHASVKFNGRNLATSLEREAYALENDPLQVHGLLKAACLNED